MIIGRCEVTVNLWSPGNRMLPLFGFRTAHSVAGSCYLLFLAPFIIAWGRRP